MGSARAGGENKKKTAAAPMSVHPTPDLIVPCGNSTTHRRPEGLCIAWTSSCCTSPMLGCFALHRVAHTTTILERRGRLAAMFSTYRRRHTCGGGGGVSAVCQGLEWFATELVYVAPPSTWNSSQRAHISPRTAVDALRNPHSTCNKHMYITAGVCVTGNHRVPARFVNSDTSM